MSAEQPRRDHYNTTILAVRDNLLENPWQAVHVFHVKLAFTPIYIQHNQCLVLVPLMREMSSVVATYETETGERHIANTATGLGHATGDAIRDEHAGRAVE